VIFSSVEYGWAVAILKEELRALVAFASKDLDRPHVSGIHLDPVLGVAVATDGHRLVKLQGSTVPMGALAASSILPITAAKAMLKSAAKEWTIWSDGRADGAGTTIRFEPCLAQFPPYKQVIPAPSKRPAAAFAVDSYFLADLKLITDALDRPHSKGVCVCPPKDPLSPILVLAGPWTVSLMPMRHERVEDVIGELEKARAA
jgi:hypothetical protein